MSDLKKATFDDLLARREQREADRLKVGRLKLPGSDTYLEAVMPAQDKVLRIYGEMAAATTTVAALEAEKHAVYDCCPQLRDKELQASLEVQNDPMSILDKLFSVMELDNLGDQALRFMGLLPGQQDGETPADTVKN